MSMQCKAGMSVDEFLVWAEGRPGRPELVDGEVRTMPPQRARHARARFAIQDALQSRIGAAGLACRMLPDGPMVRIGPSTAYEPDALVYDGRHLDEDALEIRDPLVVVEVLSPETEAIDTGEKLRGYFRVASVLHYLIVDPKARMIVHHRRGSGDIVETRLVSAGALDLTPPGLTLSLDDLFPRS